MTMTTSLSYEQLQQENTSLQTRLEEAKETLRAIRSGEVDALVVSTMQGNQVLPQQSADQQFRLLVEQMQQGAVTISIDRTIYYCNRWFAEILGYSVDQLVSRQIDEYIVSEERDQFKAFLQTASSEGGIYHEFNCRNHTHLVIPVYVSASLLMLGQSQIICLVVINLTVPKYADEAKAYLAAIVESSNDAIITKTLGGIITSWNAGAERLFGYSAQEIIGKPIGAFIPPDRQDEESKIMKRIEAGDKVKNYETVRLHKDGTKISVSVTASPVRDAKGNLIGASKLVRDITERKQAIAALKKSQALLAEMSQLTKVGGWEFDVETKELLWTEEVYRIHEVDLTYDPTIGEGIEFYLPAAKPILELALQRTIEFGEPYDLELEFNTAKGNLRWVHTIGQARREKGKTIAVSGMFQDITERKQAAEAQRRYIERLAAINRLDHAIVSGIETEVVYDTFVKELVALVPMDRTSIVILDEAQKHYLLAHQWTRHNPAFKVGEWRSVQGSAVEWLVVHRVPLFEREIGQAGNWPETEGLLREGMRSRLLLPLIVQDQLIGLLTAASHLPSAFSDENREILTEIAGQLAIAMQSTNLYAQVQRHAVELEQHVLQRTAQLMAANKELEAFSYSVSHDLRTPLRGLDGYARILLRDYEAILPEDGQRRLQALRDMAQHMGKLIDDLLAFSRLNRQSLEKRTVDIGSLVKEVLEELKADTGQRQIEIVLGELPNCQADRDLLKQVLTNLLSNAIKYSRPREVARIEVGTLENNGALVYYVRDNGVGFDMQYVDKLFGVFQRLHRPDEFEGIGVGLAIVQRIIVRHGGRVWAEAAVDNGACFYFTLEGDSINGQR